MSEKSPTLQQIRHRKSTIFDNIASFGLSGAVNHCLEHSRLRDYLGGPPLFLWATIKTVFTHPNQSIRFRIDDGPEEGICSRLGLLANGRYFGGAMHSVPEAELDDGLLDLLILKEISVASAKNIQRYTFEDSGNIFSKSSKIHC